MYQGLRVVGGLLVVLGLVFPVGMGVYLADTGVFAAADVRPDSLEVFAGNVEEAGGDSRPIREAQRMAAEQEAIDTAKMERFRAVSLLGVAMIDLAVIGLGLGLRATADMAEKLARVGIKKPA